MDYFLFFKPRPEGRRGGLFLVFNKVSREANGLYVEGDSSSSPDCSPAYHSASIYRECSLS
jgi:hypothetical protein